MCKYIYIYIYYTYIYIYVYTIYYIYTHIVNVVYNPTNITGGSLVHKIAWSFFSPGSPQKKSHLLLYEWAFIYGIARNYRKHAKPSKVGNDLTVCY